MARTDASRANGWIPEPVSGEVLSTVAATSAVEQVARKVTMTSDNLRVPRFDADGVDIVAEGAVIPVRDGVLDTVLLEANKWANRYSVSVEDERDTVISILDQFKAKFASAFAKELDNACLGVTAAATGPGTSVPFESVYKAATTAGNVTATAGALSYEDLVAAFSALEDGDYNGDLVAIAHPSFAMALRNLKDSDNNRVVGDPLGAGVPSIFGHSLVFSQGAKTSATATDKPTGNPLLIVGNRQHLILGVRDGVESQVSDIPRWDTDEVELKMRARRGFVVATPEAFQVIERTA